MKFLTLSLVVTLTTLTMASPVTHWQKHLTAESITIENHTVNGGEPITVGGFIYQRYWTPEWFWGGAGYGALLGERGGYFIGGFVLGGTFELAGLLVEPLVYLGAGGGHNAPSGYSDGGLIRPSIAVGWRIGKGLFIKLHGGYIDFPGGTIHSWLIGFSMGYYTYEICARP